MQKNYYLILGIASDASMGEIKAAFRRRARDVHPDHSGQESGPFLEVQEAYNVLSDAERRRHYDRLGSSAVRRRPCGPTADPMVKTRPAEPFGAVQGGRGFREASLSNSFRSHRPSFDELFDRLRRNFDSLNRPKAEQLESLTVEVVVTPREAAFGGMVRVGIPARATCPTCGGHGAVGPYECWRCAGHGSLTAEYPVEVEYPPMLKDGYAVRIPLTHFGIENFYLTVVFRVGTALE